MDISSTEFRLHYFQLSRSSSSSAHFSPLIFIDCFPADFSFLRRFCWLRCGLRCYMPPCCTEPSFVPLFLRRELHFRSVLSRYMRGIELACIIFFPCCFLLSIFALLMIFTSPSPSSLLRPLRQASLQALPLCFSSAFFSFLSRLHFSSEFLLSSE